MFNVRVHVAQSFGANIRIREMQAIIPSRASIMVMDFLKLVCADSFILWTNVWMTITHYKSLDQSCASRGITWGAGVLASVLP